MKKILMLTSLRTNQSGAAAMIVVIFFSIILSILTISFIRISINEQRQTTDFDLSQRAYYAAESGIEEARRAVSELLAGSLSQADLRGDQCDLPNDPSYNGTLSTDPDFDIEYTCMYIQFPPSEYRAELDTANQTRQIDIRPIDPSTGNPAVMRTLIVRWHVNQVTPGGNGLLVGNGGLVDLRATGINDIPTLANWDFPSMLEVSFISYPDANITRPEIKDVTMMVNPEDGGAGDTGNRVFINGANSDPGADDGQVVAANCNPAAAVGDHVCEMQFDFTGFAASRYVTMRIKNHYVPTTVEMTMTDGNNGGGNPLLFDQEQALVDVTGRAGTVYRRVEAFLDVDQPALLPGFVIQSAKDICKDFSYSDDPADFDGLAYTSCTP